MDNVLLNGRVVDPNANDAETKAIRALNEFVLNDKRITLSMIAIGDGLTLARKK